MNHNLTYGTYIAGPLPSPRRPRNRYADMHRVRAPRNRLKSSYMSVTLSTYCNRSCRLYIVKVTVAVLTERESLLISNDGQKHINKRGPQFGYFWGGPSGLIFSSFRPASVALVKKKK